LQDLSQLLSKRKRRRLKIASLREEIYQKGKLWQPVAVAHHQERKRSQNPEFGRFYSFPKEKIDKVAFLR